MSSGIGRLRGVSGLQQDLRNVRLGHASRLSKKGNSRKIGNIRGALQPDYLITLIVDSGPPQLERGSEGRMRLGHGVRHFGILGKDFQKIGHDQTERVQMDRGENRRWSSIQQRRIRHGRRIRYETIIRIWLLTIVILIYFPDNECDAKNKRQIGVCTQ